ncbi:hypothetical protein [Arsukibacterium indicum]|uniref:Tse2 ADP-ribosyltransferase toxin domain-containing protein n=1 Tax=Arsukibacterium indicum TaxID=2848612 RepID=A0ABS6MKX1_9GAMM|nr:hypothetical protein [Arsukibacterium indicum]MBV2129019.1 hypothetical protein [Arsukibacterium indicum]
MNTIEKLLISRGELERIYVGQLHLYLWRALHNSTKTGNPLYPDFESREVRAGVLRAPDVEVSKDKRGVEQVVSRLGEGTSLFDKPGAFGAGNWTYFEIPEGTQIPSGLIITKDSYNRRFNATHYSISPNYTMPKAQFIALLDQLARNAEAQRRKLSNG